MRSLFACLAVLAAACSGCGVEVFPAAGNSYTCELVIDQLGINGEVIPVPDGLPVIHTPKNRGFAMQIGIKPCDKLPLMEMTRRVSPPIDWPLMICIYPKDEGMNSSSAMVGFVQVLDPPGLKRKSVSTNSGVSGFWTAGGVRDWKMPTKPIRQEYLKSWKDGKMLWYWTFVCANNNQEGEFVVEIRLFPAGRWESAVRIEYGEPVVIKRFIMNVGQKP